MGITCLISMAIIAIVSYMQNKGADDSKGIEISRETFKTGKTFNIVSYAIIIVLVALMLYSGRKLELDKHSV